MIDDVRPEGQSSGKKRKAKRVKKVKPAVQVSALRVLRVSPWSAAGHAFLISLVLALGTTLMVMGLWYGLEEAGIFQKIITTLAPEGSGAETMRGWFEFKKFLFVGSALSGVLVIVLPVMTFFCAGLFNLFARFTGGLRVQLRD